MRLGMRPMLLVLCAGLAFGQATNSADVRGTVTDTSGAVLPGVTVKVRDIDKGIERTYVTNQTGLYDTGPLVPGDRYLFTFSREGFTEHQRGPMRLGVGLLGLNVQLSVAGNTQTIVVNVVAAPLLQTATAEQAQTLTADTLARLPQSGAPDWQQFIIFLPGTAGTPQGGNSFNPGMAGVSANGSMPFSTAMLDGATSNSPMSNNVIITPIFDALAEVKITDSLFSAQYGVGGVLYNQISKGGTNRFHGMAYEYFRNSALNAASYGFGTGQKASLRYNNFGGNIGGPVWKNRVFFFFGIDHTINRGGSPASPLNPVNLVSVPTLAMRQGDFTGLPDLYDPTTQVVNPDGTVTRRTFAEQYGNGNRIPAALIDPVARNIQALYPAPNTAGTMVNGVPQSNFAFVTRSSSPQRKYFGRLDADVSSSNRITASSAYNYVTIMPSSPVAPVNQVTVNVLNTNNQISDFWTISPTLTNEARLGFMAEYDSITPATLNGGWPDRLGLQFSKADVFPQVNISGFYGLGPGTSMRFNQNLFDISDVVTLIRGRHILRFGGNLIVMRANSTAFGYIFGATLGFTGAYTRKNISDTTTGSAYADFLLGYANSWSAMVSPQYGGRQKIPAVFIQDDIKLTPRLTLNLGLRWSGSTGWSDVHDNIRSFDPTVINPATNTPGAMWYAVTGANGRRRLQKPVFTTFLPRVGAAWQMSSKMTIRGGYGMYTYPWNTDLYGNGLGQASSSSGSQNDSTNGISPVVLLGSDGNTNYQGARGASINSLYKSAPLNPDSYNGQNVGFTQYDSPVPILHQWNLAVQRELTSDTVAEVAYVGSHGENLAFNTDLNQIPENRLSPNDLAFRPYPNFQSITGTIAAGISNYHALQASIRRRTNKGLFYNFNYTWSKLLDEQDSSAQGTLQGNTPFQNAYDVGANYGPSNFDIRHMFKGMAIYELPFGRRRRFLNSDGVLGRIVGGWELSTTLIVQSGNPFTPFMAVNNSFSQAGLWYPNVVGDWRLPNPSINGWFNTNAFAAPAPGTFGNMRRNSVYGPGLSQVNMALRKNFALTERLNAEIAANATNVLNHPSFGQPDPQIGVGHSARITTVTVGGRTMALVVKISF